ncbi:MAG: FKBP-type peptidyl-prolyl cis-trans isomerase [Flavobacteriales bacterium]|jgi:hypothetical protein|nr:hypothetical protein [Schleiferiaceae bacterium]|tara:strand:- start:1216 stop:1746 length:531 start_codon:yes stop_codon:yes gene_type:complete
MKPIALCLIVMMLMACVKSSQPEPSSRRPDVDVREQLIQDNREALALERQMVDSLIQTSDFAFEDQGNGLWVAVVEQSNCLRPIDTADVVVIHDVIRDMYGHVLISHARRRTMVLRDQDVEWGIQQAINQACPGDSLHLIIPSHLAHGLAGDLKNIPPMSTLFCALRIHALLPSQP